jgi:hypothetical protein
MECLSCNCAWKGSTNWDEYEILARFEFYGALADGSTLHNMNIYVKQSNTTVKDVNTHQATCFG